MKSHFKITFPLLLEHDESHAITFLSKEDDSLEFGPGIYYLYGDNGSGKTTFVNMLALIAGHIGEKTGNTGTIRFNDESYNGPDFNYIRAAEIREKFFCIFPQKAFFLPVSTRDNYIILNGTEKKKEKFFSSQESPDLLSGGQQQRILMDIVLDDKKPVWFLDEPLTNMDSERRQYFWETLVMAFKNPLRTVFFIDHWITGIIMKDKDFQHFGTLGVKMETRRNKKSPDLETQEIEIFKNSSPEEFFNRQIQMIHRELSLKRRDAFN